MIKYFLRSTLFLLIFALLFAGFTYLMVPKNNTTDAGIHDPWAKGFLAEPKNTIDVLVLGDSELYSCLVPLQIWEEHGITSYTCGTSDQKLYQTESYLSRFFETQHPKLVILETNVLYRDYSTTDRIPHIFEEHLPLLRYHDRWKTLQASDLTRPVRFNGIQRDKGYLYLTDIQPADTTGYMAYTEEIDPIASKNKETLVKIQTFCKKQGAQLLLLSSPSTANWDYLRHNAVQQLAFEQEIPYIDTNLMPEEIPIDWNTDTRDGGDHLNHDGATKLTAWMGAYLKNTGMFSDKRTAPAYAPWNDDLENFKAEISQK